MSKLPLEWWDHPNIWTFYDDLFDKQYNDYLEFRKSDFVADFYEGVDGDIVLTTQRGDIPAQLKTNKWGHFKTAHVHMSYINTKGRDSAFGLYFNDDRLGFFDVFVFGYPFLGAGIFVDFAAMRRVWESNFSNWGKFTKYGSGSNRYLSIPVRTFLGYFNSNEWNIVQKIKPVCVSDLC